MAVQILGIFESVAFTVSVIGGLIIVWSVLVAVLNFLKHELSIFRTQKTTHNGVGNIRITFGGHLLLGLDFMLASDIIHSIHNPELKELYILALIVAIRAVISFFLTKEIQETKSENEEQPPCYKDH